MSFWWLSFIVITPESPPQAYGKIHRLRNRKRNKYVIKNVCFHRFGSKMVDIFSFGNLEFDEITSHLKRDPSARPSFSSREPLRRHCFAKHSWLIFKPPPQKNLGKFWRALEWKILVYFGMVIWNILRLFGTIYGYWVMWYFVYFPRFGIMCQANLATLFKWWSRC
jgi:hypothetical protein